jgi:DnaK suppressor protein
MTKSTVTKPELNVFLRALKHTQTELGSGNRSREALTIETSSDELDRIQQASDRDYAIGNLERTSRRLREVQIAIRRFDAGTFGVCIGCEESISSKRLSAVPWASLCIACQELADGERETAEAEFDTGLVLAA